MTHTTAAPTAEGTRRTCTPGDWVTAVVLSTAISLLAVLIGKHSLHLGSAVIVLVPIIWAVLIGGLVGVQRIRPISPGTRGVSALLIEVGIILFLARLGTGIGPALSEMGEIGPAIMLQELGHIFGTVILALPVAVGIGLGRAAIGACWSIDRESFLAYAIERFGLKSPEYRGVFSVWLLGTLFGAAFISLIAGLLGSMDVFDPRALALGLGLGSGSMMLGGVSALSVIYPEHKAEIMALAALSNLVTNIVGFYAGVFVSLPMCRRLYAFWTRVLGKTDDGTDATARGSKAAGETVTSVEQDPSPARTWRILALVYAITAVCDLVINWVGTGAFHMDDLAGIGILLLLTWVAITVSHKYPMLPSSVIVLALATIVSAPFFPLADLVASTMDGLDVVMTGLAVIALIGLTLGRDVAALKSLSWKVVIIALITYTSSFVAAAVIAQFALAL